MFAIEYGEGVLESMKEFPAAKRREIAAKMKSQLTHEPTEPSRNRKILKGLKPPWDSEKPCWELRLGEYRVFYEVVEAEKRVLVRAIRHKPPHKTTEEIL